MAYKKPQIIAKSEAKQSYVADCPTNEVRDRYCSSFNTTCMCGPLN